jgi:hypothetical protein
MGKMQTAVEYAYRHRDQYDVVVWAVTDASSDSDPQMNRADSRSDGSTHPALDVVQKGAPFLLEFIVKEGYDLSRYAS